MCGRLGTVVSLWLLVHRQASRVLGPVLFSLRACWSSCSSCQHRVCQLWLCRGSPKLTYKRHLIVALRNCGPGPQRQYFGVQAQLVSGSGSLLVPGGPKGKINSKAPILEGTNFFQVIQKRPPGRLTQITSRGAGDDSRGQGQ